MTKPDKHGPILAISPHLDDAVMAVGATLAALAEAGREVIVCTVFAGQPQPPFSPVAMAFHADCGLGLDAVDQRRDEDLRALDIIGAEVVHLPHLDAIYRPRVTGWLCEAPRAMFDRGLPTEPDLRSSIAADLIRLIRGLQPAELWTCAAIGDHVDHRLTRMVTTEVAKGASLAPVLWAGLPYAIALDVPSGVRPLVFEAVNGGHLQRKLGAIEQYSSQIRMLWPDGEDWRTEFLDDARSRATLGAPELLWSAAEVQSDLSSPASIGGGS